MKANARARNMKICAFLNKKKFSALQHVTTKSNLKPYTNHEQCSHTEGITVLTSMVKLPVEKGRAT